MRIPDITTVINSVQSNRIAKEDIQLVCASVQSYWKHLHSIGAINRNVDVTYNLPTENVMYKYLDKLSRNDLIELCAVLSVSIDLEMTKEQMIKKIKGE